MATIFVMFILGLLGIDSAESTVDADLCHSQGGHVFLNTCQIDNADGSVTVLNARKAA